MQAPFRLWAVVSSLAVGVLAAATPLPAVTLLRPPEGGIQPQGAVDARGALHLIYYLGPADGGDLYYVCRAAGAAGFSAPVRVNRQPGSALAIGSIRGAQMALGRNGRVHVAWMGSKHAPRVQVRGEGATPYLYTRLNDQGTGFEPERDVLTWASGLDGGGSVAADGRGNVYVAWHASAPGNHEAEAGRAVYVAHSPDEGRTFAPETLASPVPTGACGCCGMRAFADPAGRLFLLYRAATDQVQRGMRLLVATPPAPGFRLAPVSEWRLATCPMSSAALTATDGGVLAAWEAADQVQFASVRLPALSVSAPISPPGEGKRKHPSVARNGRGQTLLAWTEDTGWEKGGSLAWEVFDAGGHPLEAVQHRNGVPTWSLVCAVAEPDGGFVIIY